MSDSVCAFVHEVGWQSLRVSVFFGDVCVCERMYVCVCSTFLFGEGKWGSGARFLSD